MKGNTDVRHVDVGVGECVPLLQIVAQSACLDKLEAWTVGSFNKVAFSLTSLTSLTSASVAFS